MILKVRWDVYMNESWDEFGSQVIHSRLTDPGHKLSHGRVKSVQTNDVLKRPLLSQTRHDATYDKSWFILPRNCYYA